MTEPEILGVFIGPMDAMTWLSFQKPPKHRKSAVNRADVAFAMDECGRGKVDADWIDRFVAAMERRGYRIVASDCAVTQEGDRTVGVLSCRVPEEGSRP